MTHTHTLSLFLSVQLPLPPYLVVSSMLLKIVYIIQPQVDTGVAVEEYFCFFFVNAIVSAFWHQNRDLDVSGSGGRIIWNWVSVEL